MQKSLLSYTGIVLLAAILLVINGISDTVFNRFYVDLTQEKLYSLSPGTEKIVDSVQQPITFRLYYSKTDASKYPVLKLYATRVLDLLKEYERTSNGKIKLEVYDPRPDSEEEEWAQKYGLTPLALPTGEQVFFGMAAVNSFGQEESIPVFDLSRQQYLEYDVSKIVYALKAGKKPVVGILSSLDIQGAPQEQPYPMRPQQEKPWIVVNQLSRFAEVRYLKTDTDKIEDGVDVLMVIHPKNLPEQTVYAIDQFVMKGKSAFIAVDPYCAVDQPKTDPNNPMAAMSAERSSNLAGLLGAWGVSLKEKKVVGDVNLATKVSAGQGQPESFVVWLTLSSQAADGPEIINGTDIVTSQLDNVMLPWAGALELKQVEGTTVEPLFKTTKQAMLYADNDIRFSGDNPEQLLKKYHPGVESYVLAARLGGKLKSSFKSKPGTEQKEKEQNMSIADGHLTESTGPANVVVIGDADFLADQYSAMAQRFLGAQLITLLNDNLTFAANAVENLSGSNDLISLRSRGTFTRPFVKVQEIEARAQSRYQQEEGLFEAQLNAANERLSQVQGQGQGESKQAFSRARMSEIKQLREERNQAQRRLRDVRRKLREDKENLGALLFGLNTFLIPVLLVIGSFILYLRSGRRKENKSEETKA